MTMKFKTIALIICMSGVICIPINLFAQGETAVPFLLFSASPEGNGMGGINASRITDDAMAELANPAQLGLQALHQFVSTGFYTSTTDWLGCTKIISLTMPWR
jgi:hypothetical protein